MHQGRVPPPPLPLRLRPPLRKKKSFSRVSRVSTWLFPGGGGGEHRRDISLDSITNLPRPVTGTDGFYQVAQPPLNPQSPSRRSSFDTVSSVSDWSAAAEKEEDEEQTIPTSWSPSSHESMRNAFADTPPINAAFGRRETFARPQHQLGRSVGVAF
ncbi:hypothetical protein SLS62_007213 [Diatrype stigma]|uniref:Uncharacterized protein n=1 Tax=Diatrype stigma TaxID=117547 RepID=A0AAN9YQY0_9PEZI